MTKLFLTCIELLWAVGTMPETAKHTLEGVVLGGSLLHHVRRINQINHIKLKLMEVYFHLLHPEVVSVQHVHKSVQSLTTLSTCPWPRLQCYSLARVNAAES